MARPEDRVELPQEPPASQQEDGSDFANPLQTGTTAASAVVTATDWTTQTVLFQLARGNIELNPAFQRRDAWKAPRKSKFIESLILGIPVPQLVLAERKDKRNSFIVIDGKQRLLSLRQFCASDDDSEYEQFRLTALDIRRDLHGTTYEKLRSDPTLDTDLTNFENQTIRTVVIKNWPDENFLYQVFLRLNTGSVPLSPQELRQALHPGKFAAFVDSFSMESGEIRELLNLSEPDFRMRDAEIVIRYFAFRNFLTEYTGNLSPLLDLTTKYYNQLWVAQQILIQKQADNLRDAIRATLTIFGRYACRKWNGHQYERALNRAIFDIMVLYFDDVEIRRLSLENKEAVEAQFRWLCDNDSVFLSSIEGTTKSIDSIYTRIRAWGEALQRVISIPIALPIINDQGKIVLRP